VGGLLNSGIENMKTDITLIAALVIFTASVTCLLMTLSTDRMVDQFIAAEEETAQLVRECFK